jgi:membrane protein DedA with SNARE-associated domain
VSSVVPRNRYLVVVALVVFFLSLVEITHVFPLPFESAVGGAFASSLVSVSSLVNLVSKVGYAGLFALMVLESASFPIPSEVVLPFTGYLVYLGTLNFALALAVSTAALLVGALMDYYLALLLGRPFVVALLRRVHVKPEAIDSADDWISRKGWWSIFIARFVPVLRAVISIPAGVLKMDLKRFVLMTLLGSFVWSAALLYLGYTAGALWNTAYASSTSAVSNLILVLLAVFSAAYVAYYLYPRQKVAVGQQPTADAAQ